MSDSIGFVGVFSDRFSRSCIERFVGIWLKQFGSVEQVCPGPAGPLTLRITTEQDVIWEKSMQFRVTEGADFSWIYLTMGQRVVETTGLASAQSALVLEVLMELPGLIGVVDQRNDRRLDELEEEGLL